MDKQLPERQALFMDRMEQTVEKKSTGDQITIDD